MGSKSKDRKKQAPKTKEDIEVSKKHFKLRLVAFILLLGVGAAGFTYGFSQLISSQKGWKQIEVNAAAKANLGDEFYFNYNLGTDGASPTTQRRELETIYSNVMVSAYRQFNVDEAFDDMVSLYAINHGPNQVFTVDDMLYWALEKVQQSGSRLIYLGPSYQTYEGVFFSQEDWENADFDPLQNDVLREEFTQVAAFAADPDAVDMELLGDNQVRLKVSEEYLQYAQAHSLETFVDFMWARNAFVLDYLAQQLIGQGYTYGNISSYNGFVRNLDGRGVEEYGFSLFDKADSTLRRAATMAYTGRMALVNYRNYPITDAELGYYYLPDEGEAFAPYLSTRTGLPGSALDELVCYSAAENMGCADILLSSYDGYMEGLTPQWHRALKDKGIESIFINGTEIGYTDPNVRLNDLYHVDAVTYTAENVLP